LNKAARVAAEPGSDAHTLTRIIAHVRQIEVESRRTLVEGRKLLADANAALTVTAGAKAAKLLGDAATKAGEAAAYLHCYERLSAILAGER
jgi:hypothetical protein